MENALLYTFSTIAQALGGAIALLSAFVLYRLQSLDALMWQDSDDLSDAIPNGEPQIQHDQRRAQGAWKDILIEVKKLADESHRLGLANAYGRKGKGPFLRLSTTVVRHQAIQKGSLGHGCRNARFGGAYPIRSHFGAILCGGLDCRSACRRW
jgi:hypothetical protein